MEAAVHQRHLHIDDRESRQWACHECLAHSALHGRNELDGDRPASDPILELDARTPFQRLRFDPNVAVLPVSARLTHEAALGPRGRRYRLAVGDLRASDVPLDAVLALDAVDYHVKMQLAHA